MSDPKPDLRKDYPPVPHSVLPRYKGGHIFFALSPPSGISLLKESWPNLRDEGEFEDKTYGLHHIISVPEADYIESLLPKPKGTRKRGPRPKPKKTEEQAEQTVEKPQVEQKAPEKQEIIPVEVEVIKDGVQVTLHKEMQLTDLSSMKPVTVPEKTYTMKLVKFSGVKWIGFHDENFFIGKSLAMWEMLVKGEMGEMICQIEGFEELKKL